MLRVVAPVSLCILIAAIPVPVRAQQLIESYVALLSESDHFNSQGQRLTSAAAIIRQDRANYHRFGIRDPEDESDTLFADESNRQALEQMLERGHDDPAALSRIVNGTVLVHVNAYRNPNGPYVQVTVLNNPKATSSSSTTELPNRFRGAWIDAGDNPMKMTVTADGISFGTPTSACTFTDVKVANEEGSAFEVNWHCPDSAAGAVVKTAFRLMKVWGKEVLVLVNTEEPTIVSVYERAH